MTDFNEGEYRKKLSRLKTYYARLRKNYYRCMAEGCQRPHSEIEPFPEELCGLICGAKHAKAPRVKLRR